MDSEAVEPIIPSPVSSPRSNANSSVSTEDVRPSARLRWQLAIPGAMQAISMVGVDDQGLAPEDLTQEEFQICVQVMGLSNDTIRAENELLETYLANMDPILIDNMDTILDAATAAIHKAERTVQLGVMAAVTTLPQTSREKESSTTTPRSSGHTGGSSGKVAAFTLSDKGPRIQPSQKMEIIQREMDCLRASYEEDKSHVDKSTFALQCKRDSSTIRLGEVFTLRKHFEDCVSKEWVDRRTMKIPGEQIIDYFEHRNKSDAVLTKGFQTRRKNIRIQLDALTSKVKELGEELKLVDYEKLTIQDNRVKKNLSNTMNKLTELKKTNTAYQTALNRARQKMMCQVGQVEKKERDVTKLEGRIDGLLKDESQTMEDLASRQLQIDHLVDLNKNFTAPKVMEYVQHKADLHEMRKAVKVVERRNRLYEITTANLKKKSLQLSSSVVNAVNCEKADANLRFRQLYRGSNIWKQNASFLKDPTP